jgi:hypothetical protein
MDVKEAVKRAKNYVTDLFAEENITSLGLEEIEHNSQAGVWEVTLGFSRPWNTQRNALTMVTGEPAVRRVYRVIEVRDIDGEVLSVKRRGDNQE